MNQPSSDQADRPQKLLLVDDDAFVRRILALGLRKAGFDIQLSEHGEEALEELKTSTFDAVIVDLMMPVMDGRSFIRRAREQYGNDLPILVLTSVDREDAARDVLEGGASAMLLKPAKVPQILAKLQEIGV